MAYRPQIERDGREGMYWRRLRNRHLRVQSVHIAAVLQQASQFQLAFTECTALGSETDFTVKERETDAGIPRTGSILKAE